MLLVAEADGDVALDQLDPVEDAAAHIARALEGIAPATGDQDGVLAVLELVFQIGVFGVAQKRCGRSSAHDRQRKVEVDEGHPYRVRVPGV